MNDSALSSVKLAVESRLAELEQWALWSSNYHTGTSQERRDSIDHLESKLETARDELAGYGESSIAADKERHGLEQKIIELQEQLSEIEHICRGAVVTTERPLPPVGWWVGELARQLEAERDARREKSALLAKAEQAMAKLVAQEEMKPMPLPQAIDAVRETLEAAERYIDEVNAKLNEEAESCGAGTEGMAVAKLDRIGGRCRAAITSREEAWAAIREWRVWALEIRDMLGMPGDATPVEEMGRIKRGVKALQDKVREVESDWTVWAKAIVEPPSFLHAEGGGLRDLLGDEVTRLREVARGAEEREDGFRAKLEEASSRARVLEDVVLKAMRGGAS